MTSSSSRLPHTENNGFVLSHGSLAIYINKKNLKVQKKKYGNSNISLLQKYINLQKISSKRKPKSFKILL